MPSITINLHIEYNDKGFLVHAIDFPGAYARGGQREEALSKIAGEVNQYLSWARAFDEGFASLSGAGKYRLGTIQEQKSGLSIEDADSEAIFSMERSPLTEAEYVRLRELALRSAQDFQALYDSVPQKDGTTLKPRETFYGPIPRTAREMYGHTMGVNSYYFGEIKVPAKDGPDIASCRREAFALLEKTPGFLENPVFLGRFEEEWSLRKVCRRFLWHDRIHAKAMYKMASSLCGKERILNPFRFTL